MAETAPSLGDFFKSKGKKKVKASNLNKAEETKSEEKKTKTKTDDDAWEEEQVVATTLKVEVVGKLVREENKKEEEETAGPAWGSLGKNKDAGNAINEKRFPTLAKSNASSSINIDDGSDGKVNIKTSVNHFAALEGHDNDSDEEVVKRPKEIKPAMVTKKQGEFAKAALQREVDKYAVTKEVKKKGKQVSNEDEEDDENDREEEETMPAPAAVEEVRKKKPSEKKEEKKGDTKAKEDEELEEDVKILVDLVASKEKYKSRKKLPTMDLPKEELEEQKENKRVQPTNIGKKKKFVVEEETEKKLAYAEW